MNVKFLLYYWRCIKYSLIKGKQKKSSSIHVNKRETIYYYLFILYNYNMKNQNSPDKEEVNIISYLHKLPGFIL